MTTGNCIGSLEVLCQWKFYWKALPEWRYLPLSLRGTYLLFILVSLCNFINNILHCGTFGLWRGQKVGHLKPFGILILSWLLRNKRLRKNVWHSPFPAQEIQWKVPIQEGNFSLYHLSLIELSVVHRKVPSRRPLTQSPHRVLLFPGCLANMDLPRLFCSSSATRTLPISFEISEACSLSPLSKKT